MQRFDESKEAYFKSLEIAKRLAKDNPKRYNFSYGLAYMNLGLLYDKLTEYEKAYPAHRNSSDILKLVAQETPHPYHLYVIQGLVNAGHSQMRLLERELDFKHREIGLGIVSEIEETFAKADSTHPAFPSFQENAKELDEFFSNFTEKDGKIITQVNEIAKLNKQNTTETNQIKQVATQEDIIQKFETLFNLHPKNKKVVNHISNAYGSLSHYYLFNRQFKEAENASRRGLVIDSKQKWLNVNLAIGLLFQGKLEYAKSIILEMKDLPSGNRTYKDVFLEDLDALEKEGITHSDVTIIRALLIE